MRHVQRRPFVKIAIITAALILIAVIGYHKYSGHVAQSVASKKPATSPVTTPAAAKPTPAKTVPTKPTSHTDAQLQQIVDTWSSKQSFDSSIVVQELNGDLRGAGRNASTQMVTASTYKIYVAYAALHEVEQGTYTMNTPTRTGQTVSAALQKMILQSDNSSAEALGFLVGWDKINTLAASAGASNTNINNYDASGNPVNGDKHSTANDLTTMVTKLQQGTLLNTSNTQLLLGLMKNQEWRERIPAGVSSGIAVADKPGWLDDVENDAAIVYGPKSTYTLVIMTNGSTTQPLADLSKLIYNYLET